MIRAEYLITTPLFMGGAVNDGNAEPELRAPSIKGLLRFWFRATALPSLGTVEKVWKKERELFGSTDGQGKFLLSIIPSNSLETMGPGTENFIKPEKGLYLKYLGYGVYGSRQFFKPGGRFTVELRLRKRENLKVTNEDIGFLKKSLIALGLFGGAGSRSRRGFGSLTLTKLEIEGEQIWKRPASVEELEWCIKNFISELNIKNQSNETQIPPYTSFSKIAKTSIVEGHKNEDGLGLLNRIGEELRKYRGNAGSENGDVIIIKRFLKGEKINCHPIRIVFGLPHNYFFRKIKQFVGVLPSGSKNRRRASPLFIHIHDLEDGKFAAVLTLMPGKFLPDDKKVVIKSGRRSVEVPVNVDFKLIEDFINRPRDGFKVVWP